ncbi:MAG: hypothetical protein AB1715_11355 [Acidobacteriota bacterium]
MVIIPGNAAWTDTGLEVEQAAEIAFEAEGTISLQKGNPQADCGADGYDLRTVQQPLPEQNLGALIGKVVVAVTVTKDEKTGEERTEEVAELFYVGRRNRVAMPVKGRLFLGINDGVIGDNTGEFRVTIVYPAYFLLNAIRPMVIGTLMNSTATRVATMNRVTARLTFIQIDSELAPGQSDLGEDLFPFFASGKKMTDVFKKVFEFLRHGSVWAEIRPLLRRS